MLEEFIEQCPDVSVINMIKFLERKEFYFKIKEPVKEKKEKPVI